MGSGYAGNGITEKISQANQLYFFLGGVAFSFFGNDDNAEAGSLKTLVLGLVIELVLSLTVTSSMNSLLDINDFKL